MISKNNETVEFVRACVQTYRKLHNYSNDLKKQKQIKSVDFEQSSFGPDRENWPGSPVGYSWDIEVLLLNNPDEEIYTLDVTFESNWLISAERLKQGENGLETVEKIFEHNSLETSKCTELLCKCAVEFIQFCDERLGMNV